MDTPNIKELISAEDIKKRVKELGEQITKDYAGKDLFIIVLLKGSAIFASDLVREIASSNLEMGFMRVSSYHGTTTTGEVRVLHDLEEGVANRHVLIVEDIVDTGLTLTEVCKILKSRNPASLEICTYLNKPSRRRVDVDVKYVGQEIDDLFVIGYGLDYDEKYRNLPYIGLMEV